MTRFSFEELDKVAKNRYEAVLIASQRARQINSLRLAQLERMAEENVTIDGRKVTTLALTDVAGGKVKFRREGNDID
ncbi:MAG: DNA-directed RNA polymerase subunit omega [Candidatus Zixiibacteriota bacterium]|nr:MAG: DNA-directed RNA polymerase subunit omega [candidate division Zixibacteria bacterium]